MKENIFNIAKITLGYILYLIPWTLMLTQYKFFAFLIYLIIFIITIIPILRKKNNVDKIEKMVVPSNIKGKKELLKDVKKEKVKSLLNIISVSILFILTYILIQTFLPSIVSYYNQFFYLNTYAYLNDIVYILIASIFVPFMENIMIRKHLLKISSKKMQILFIIINCLFIFIIQPYFVTGLFFALITFLTSLNVLKEKELKNSFIFQIILNIVYCLNILYLSEFKLLLTIIFVTLFLTTMIFNLIDYTKKSS